MKLSSFKIKNRVLLFLIFLLLGAIANAEDFKKNNLQSLKSISYANKIYIDTDNYNNLWSIGLELKDSFGEFSVYQIMISLLETNEEAFINSNINFLSKGFVLEIPTREKISKNGINGSLREVARQNLEANVGPIDYSVLKDVLVLSEPEISLVGTPDELSTFKDDLFIKYPVNEIQSKAQTKEEIPFFVIESDDLSKLEENFKQNPKEEAFMEISSYLILGAGFFFFILLIINKRSSQNINHSAKHEEELGLDLDEEFGEIGDPIQARINLAITYIEMKETIKAKNLLEQVMDSKPNESQKNQATILLNNINQI
jgi:FimV-like protein